MHVLLSIHWKEMFEPSGSIIELLIRGSITYWACFLYLRFFRRSSGQIGVGDILLINLISDAAQNAMAGSYQSITEGVLLVGVLTMWDYVIEWAGFHSLFVQRLSAPKPLLLIEDGKLHHRNLKKALITHQELMGLLRENNIDDLANVKTCYLESSGNISVLSKEK